MPSITSSANHICCCGNRFACWFALDRRIGCCLFRAVIWKYLWIIVDHREAELYLNGQKKEASASAAQALQEVWVLFMM